MSKYPDLYPDFKLKADTCEAEPIHRPLAVQGHGFLMAFDDQKSDHLLATGEHLFRWLGVAEEQVWEHSVSDWLPETLTHHFWDRKALQDRDSINYTAFEWKGRNWNLIQHFYGRRRIWEIEPMKVAPLSPFELIRGVSNLVTSHHEFNSLFEEFTLALKSAIGYDRIMVYQFNSDGHGCVVGEAKEPHLESFLGLHYPATDIPQIARDLFLLNRSRLIPDVNQSVQWLRFNPGLSQKPSPLDLSLSQLRATSPIHIEYLKNMGVSATMTLAIVCHDRLWGLVACHHYQSMFMPFDMRKSAELATNILAKRILELEQEKQKIRQAQFSEKKEAFLADLSPGLELDTQLISKNFDLRLLCESDGAAVVTSQGVYVVGSTPTASELGLLHAWLAEREDSALFQSSNLLQDLSWTQSFSSPIGGIMAVSVTEDQKCMLMWFRRPERLITNWGGNPNEPYQVLTSEKDGNIRLSPRKSFEKWQVQVENQSRPWMPWDLERAQKIRDHLLRIDLRRTAGKVMQLREDFQQLTTLASHDLQAPLKTLKNYLSLIGKEEQEALRENFSFYLERADLATERMKQMIKGLLDYSRMQTREKIERIQLNDALAEVLMDLDAQIGDTQTRIVHATVLPEMRVNKEDVKALFRNLVHNAIKYVRPDHHPVIEVGHYHLDEHIIIYVQDQGIGIQPRYHKRIFELFVRLHSKDEFPGSGMGLAQCKRIVEKYDGTIEVRSELGQGARFELSFHSSFFFA